MGRVTTEVLLNGHRFQQVRLGDGDFLEESSGHSIVKKERKNHQSIIRRRCLREERNVMKRKRQPRSLGGGGALGKRKTGTV